MADSSHDLIFRILTQYLGQEQAAKAAADIDKMNAAAGKTAGAMTAATATTGGLATAVPNLDARVEAFTVKTEAEYLAILKAAEALRANITLRQAAGLEVTNETQRLAALDATLSTEAALRIAETTETKAAIAALYQHAAATEVDTAAGMESAVVGRKMVSLFDEMSRGQRGQMVSTLGSLMKNMGVGLPGMLAMLAAFAAINILVTEFRKHLKGSKKDTEELNRALAEVERQLGEFDMSVWKAQREGIDQAKTAAENFEAAIHHDKSALDDLKDAQQSQLTILRAEAKARADILKAQEESDLAAAGGDRVKEAEVRGRYARITAANEQEGEQAETLARQVALDVASQALGKAQFTAAGATGAAQHQDAVVAAQKMVQTRALQDLQLQTGSKDLQEAMGKRDSAAQAVAAFQANEQTGRALPAYVKQVFSSKEQAQDMVKFLQQQIDAYQSANKAVDDAVAIQKNLEKAAQDANAQVQQLGKEIDTLTQEISTTTVTQAIATGGQAQVQDINQKTTFATAVGAELAPPGTKLTDQQKTAEAEMQKMFQAAGGSFDVFIRNLREFRGTQEQWMKQVNEEFNALQAAIKNLGARQQNHLSP